MRKPFIAPAVVVAVLAVFSGTDAVAGGDSSTPGGDIFAAKCASCHAKDGSGSTAIGKKMALRNLGSADVQKQTDQQLSDITAKGKKKMPAYEKKLTAPQITALVAHMRTLAK